jgi:ketopantoate reductase
VKEARGLGLAAPVNETLNQLVITLEESYPKQILK